MSEEQPKKARKSVPRITYDEARVLRYLKEHAPPESPVLAPSHRRIAIALGMVRTRVTQIASRLIDKDLLEGEPYIPCSLRSTHYGLEMLDRWDKHQKSTNGTSQRVRYSDKFKRDAVSLVTEHGHTQKSAAEKVGVSYSTFNSWIRKYSEQ